MVEESHTPSTPLRLDELARGRDNNLNLLRFLAASAVVYAHSFGILEKSAAEPFFRTMGRGLGDFGVDIFFVVSGFLVTKSLLGKDSVGTFAWARLTRVFPALWLSTLIWVLVAGLLLSPLSAGTFWSQSETLTYILKNSTMLPGAGAQVELPNAFPFTVDAFNIPLWTLPHELQMYGLLAVLGAVGLARRGWIFIGIATFGLVGLILDHAGMDLGLGATRLRFLFFFFAGASLYSYRNFILLRQSVFWGLCSAVLCVCLLTREMAIRQLALAIATPYLVLALAYGPRGPIRRFNAFGDYSYGIYIFAFPLQLMLANYLQVDRPLMLFLFSMCAVLPLAALSWHYVESKLLKVPAPAWVERVIKLNTRVRSSQYLEKIVP
jgi:peptidoglycan/LPS O-acetylase OafA/YrhL